MGRNATKCLGSFPLGLLQHAICSLMMRPLIRYWHERGLKAIVYIDDGIVAVRGRQEASVESGRVKEDIENALF